MDKVTMEITNDRLEEAIAEYAKEQSKEKLTEILNLLRPTQLLVPAMLKAPNEPVPCFLQSPEGNQYLAVYTSKKHIPKKPKSQAILSMTFPACNSVVVNPNIKVAGMVINPFSTNFVLKRELIERLHEADVKAAKQVKLTPEQFRVLVKKQIEFGTLPKRLFTEKEAFMNLLRDGREEFVRELFTEAFREEKLNTYTRDDFSVMALDIGPDLRMVRIDFPEDGMVAPLCYRVYLTFDPITKKAGYYTIEKMAEGEAHLLGGFLEDGKHVSYGEAPVEGAEMDRIILLARSTGEMTS